MTIKVTCSGVQYFTQTKYVAPAVDTTGTVPVSPSPGEMKDVGGATVSFNPVLPSDGTQGLETFTLTFTNVDGELGYFPGKQYDLTIKAVTK